MNSPNDTRTIEDLVKAAHSYFLRFGYSRVSTDEIASSSGRSKKTLYKHFAAKEQLLQAVLERMNTEAEARLVELAGSQDDDLPILEGMLQAVATNIISTQETLFTDLREKQPDLFDKARDERQSALIAIIVPVLQRLSSAGRIRDDIAFNEVVSMFIATVEAAGSPLEFATQDPATRRRIDLAIRLTVDGLRFGASAG